MVLSLWTALSDSSTLVFDSADSELALLVLRAETEILLDKPRKTVLDKLSILDWSFFPDRITLFCK